MANRKLKKMFAESTNSFDTNWNAGAQYLKSQYGVDIDQPWETIPKNTLQQILNDPNYHYYIDGPNEGLYVS